MHRAARRRAAALAACALLGCGEAAPPGPERIVLVSIDTLRADHVGAYGASHGATPHLDALAAGGVTFLTAVSPTPLTLPSHTTLLTGLDPPRHGVHHNGLFELDPAVPLLPEALGAAGWATGAFVGAVVLDRQYGLARGFDHYGDQMSVRRASVGGYAERRAAEVVDEALAWARGTDGRFFLFVHLYDPHADYDPPGPFRRHADPYVGEIAYADAQLGRLRTALARRFPERGTLWIVTSDHGEARGQHGELTHGYTLYEGTQHVPLVLAGPGLPPGARVEAPVRLADVAPTVRALAGLGPEDADGRDLGPLVAGTEEAERPAYLETLAPRLDHGWSALYGVRQGRFKYLRAPTPELYDLAADPRENVNLAVADAERARALDALLEARLEAGRPVTMRGALSATRRAQLEQLGYLASGAVGEVTLGEVGGAHPRDGLARVVRWFEGRQLMTAGRVREALAVLEAADIDAPMVFLDRSWAAARAGDGERAERYAREAAARAGGVHPWVPYALGEALEVQGRLDEAEAAFREAQALDPAEGDLVAAEGRIAEARGQREEAVALYERAIASRAASVEGLWRLAALRIEDGRREEAEALLARLPPDEALRPEAAARLVRAERRAGAPARARARLEAALEAFPEADALRALAEETDSDRGEGPQPSGRGRRT